MLLNFKLITNSTSYSLDRISKIDPTVCPHLFFLKDFINPDLLVKLLDYITTEEIVWTKELKQEYNNRLKLNWIPESVIEETHIVLDNLTADLNQKFNRTNKFLGLSIWKDQEGYTISMHEKDNNIIDVAVQIYLSESTVDLATKFLVNGTILTTDYKKNYGYLVDNSVGVPHYMNTPVPADHIRYSLYAMWGHSG